MHEMEAPGYRLGKPPGEKMLAIASAGCHLAAGRGDAYTHLDHRVRATLLATVWLVRYDCPPTRGHVTFRFSCRSKACPWSMVTPVACGCSRYRCARRAS